ncbi:hypothetical protein EV2_020221 [Malus domestica]
MWYKRTEPTVIRETKSSGWLFFDDWLISTCNFTTSSEICHNCEPSKARPPQIWSGKAVLPRISKEEPHNPENQAIKGRSDPPTTNNPPKPVDLALNQGNRPC